MSPIKKIQPPKKPHAKYVVHTEDAQYWFKYGRRLKEKEVTEIFEKRILPWKQEAFPGLVLQDTKGNLFRPELQVVLVPIVPVPIKEEGND